MKQLKNLRHAKVINKQSQKAIRGGSDGNGYCPPGYCGVCTTPSCDLYYCEPC